MHVWPISADQFKSFLEAVQADSTLQEKLDAAANAEAAVAIAKDAGFTISVEEIRIGKDVSSDDLADLCGGNSKQTARLEAGLEWFRRWSNPM
jgi:predicted ribosomally synthesized peptide with nif11-like leader